MLDGDVQYYLNGGGGKDAITFATLDILGGSSHALILGSTANFFVQIDGGAGADTITLVLDLLPTTPGLTGRASINVFGGAGNDAVSLTGIGSPLAPSLGDVFIDGGNGTDTYSESLTFFSRSVQNFEL